MMLEPHGGGVEPDGQIDLLVFGIHEPGPSITTQLTQLLQRRLLLIAVDMLSAVLTKNPHFHWKRADLNFILSFEEEWRSLDETHDTDPEDHVVDYEFPEPTDPGMILLYFRQNLCGSTFFHRLNGFVGEIKYDNENDDDDSELHFKAQDFTFRYYYNNSPSNLDPNMQSVSTLTEKGAAFCRQAGAGIAIITVSLVDSNGDPVEKIHFGMPAHETTSVTGVAEDSLRLHRISSVASPGDETDSDSVHVRVSITSTALKLSALHTWVLLTLNQVYSAWCVERHLERMQLNLIRQPLAPMIPNKANLTSDEEIKKKRMDILCPGLPAMISFLEKIHELPEFGKHVCDGIVGASSVANVALDFLEMVVSLSSTETLKPPSISDVFIVRLSRSDMPQQVRLGYLKNRTEASVSLVQDGKEGPLLSDKPIDCPEYVCFYCHTQYADKSRDGKKNLPMLFKEVVVSDGNDKSASIARLERMKESHPHLFFRSFAFVLCVKRNRRAFLSYNWTPQAVKT